MRHLILTTAVLSGLPLIGQADASLVFNLTHGNKTENASIQVHEGRALLTQGNQTWLFDAGQTWLAQLDHRHRKLLRIDEAAVDRLTTQGQQATQLLRGVSEQLALLPPHQRDALQGLLGNKALPTPPPKARLDLSHLTFKAVGTQRIAGVNCHAWQVLTSQAKQASVCLADAAALPLAAADYATLEALRQWVQQLTQRAAPLAQQWGFPLPTQALPGAGLPVDIQSFAQPAHLSLQTIHLDAVPAEVVQIPVGYQNKTLDVWKWLH